jgi:hypothetical protein
MSVALTRAVRIKFDGGGEGGTAEELGLTNWWVSSNKQVIGASSARLSLTCWLRPDARR